MADILLINSPIRLAAEPSEFPIGLGIIASVLEQRGHNVNVIDANAYRYPQEELLKEFSLYKNADIVGISGLITTYGFQKWLAGKIRDILPSAAVVAGGGCVTSVPELVFKNCGVDFAVLHEGENTIVELVDAIIQDKRIEDVKGIAFSKNGSCVKTPKRELIDDLDMLPLPAYDRFPADIYIKNLTKETAGFNNGLRAISILCSRGCPFNCNFCFHFFGGPSYRMRSVRNIMQEIDFLMNRYGVRFFSLRDENLLVRRDYLEELCIELKKRKVSWECGGRADLADDRLKMLRDAGCTRVCYGIESGSQKILDNMNKSLTPDLIRKGIRNARKYGIRVETSWIYGYPGESRGTLRENYLLKKELGLRPGGFFINPYPGTRLYDDCLNAGLIGDEEEFILKLSDASQFVINLSEIADDKEFLDTVFYYERKLLMANCIRDPRNFFRALVYKSRSLFSGRK